MKALSRYLCTGCGGPVLAQREMEKRRSPLVHRFRPFGAGIFLGMWGLSSDDSGAARCEPCGRHEPQWSLPNRVVFRFLPVASFSTEKFGARIASERRSPLRWSYSIPQVAPVLDDHWADELPRGRSSAR